MFVTITNSKTVPEQQEAGFDFVKTNVLLIFVFRRFNGKYFLILTLTLNLRTKLAKIGNFHKVK